MGKINGYIHYKLPNGLHVYVYMEDFDMCRVDRSSEEDYWRTERQADEKIIHIYFSIFDKCNLSL